MNVKRMEEDRRSQRGRGTEILGAWCRKLIFKFQLKKCHLQIYNLRNFPGFCKNLSFNTSIQ